ncbi:MAG TPA: low temperature requirement protein A [Actinomycetota bacterium]|jgi:low temperature requirement protein LtrA
MSDPRPTLEHRVTPLELFLDLVFAFAFTQVTTLLSDEPTWAGLGHGLLVLSTLWLAWTAYAWLTNTVDPEEGAALGTMLIAIAAMFFAALAVPEAFGRYGVLFGVALLVARAMALILLAVAVRGERSSTRTIFRSAPFGLGSAALILGAGFVDGWPRSLMWLIAVVIGLLGPLFGKPIGWHLQPAHFVERYGLIIIIAIGESLIAIGLGARKVGLGPAVMLSAALGLAVAASFWLAYFDFFPLRIRQLLLDRSGRERTAVARDVFTYLHLPLVVGIILFAFAMKTMLADVWARPDALLALCLCGGPALYLSAYVGVRLRVAGTPGRGRFTACLLCAGLIPVATVVPTVAALAMVAAVWVCLHAYELVWWREERAQVRALRA